MPNTPTAPVTKKSAYQRPYKTRQQRREADRRKHDESSDRRLLLKIVGIVGLFVAVIFGFMLNGAAEQSSESAQITQNVR